MISVLVVDADDDALRTIGEILHGAGIGAALASTGLHALTLFRRVPVDVVVVDLRLSDFAGIEMLRAFRGERSGVPVIVTGVSSPGAAIEAGRLGAADYLDKPIRAVELIDAVLSRVPIACHFRWAEASQSSWTHPQVLHAIRAIDDRYWDTDLTVRSLARELGVSTEHLCRVLKRQTGGTFVALLRRARVRAACRLLISTTLCMKEIAAHVGFTSPNRFARDFKKLCGVTPSSYRIDALRGSAFQDETAPALVSES
jgi:YesN/AraC family two-component response regulator